MSSDHRPDDADANDDTPNGQERAVYGPGVGLLALMLLVHARHRARTGGDGSLIAMADQDRSLWDGAAIDEGVKLITAALPRGPVGPYQLQAAIAAVHDESDTSEATDWAQIAALYGVLLHLDDNPVVASTTPSRSA